MNCKGNFTKINLKYFLLYNMTLQPIKDVSEYKRLKKTLRDRFESEKSGDQSLLEEQTKKYKPLLTSQQEISKTMQDVANQIVESQNEGQAALQPSLPLLQNMQRAQIAAPEQPGQQALAMAMSPSQYATPQTSLTGQASGQDSISHIPIPIGPASSRKDISKVSLDEGLDQHDIDNLYDMKLPLPSKVYQNDAVSETLSKIKTQNKSIGQYLGIGPSSKSISKEAKISLESQKNTLKKYKTLIENTESAKKLISTRRNDKKTGTGVTNIPSAVHEISFYSSVDDLCNRLALLCASKEAGNNGLNNNIKSILDELLRIKAIERNEYNHLHSIIFN